MKINRKALIIQRLNNVTNNQTTSICARARQINEKFRRETEQQVIKHYYTYKKNTSTANNQMPTNKNRDQPNESTRYKAKQRRKRRQQRPRTIHTANRYTATAVASSKSGKKGIR